MNNERIDLTLEDEDGYNFENVLHGFDDIIGRLRVADDRIHGTAAWCDASGGAVPILERYPLLLAELKRCYERIDYLKSIAEEYRQERPEEYCAKCYAYLSEYDGDGVKECLCSDCDASE